MRCALRCLAAIILLAVIAAAVTFGYFRYGFYNVAASYPDRPAVASFLAYTADNSVSRHAAGIRVPSLDDPAMVASGANFYRHLCAECHGAPGGPPEDLAKGLNPAPPPLVESAGEWKPNELFWLTKHGVRMTGMPAWGPTHTDEEIWAMVAFLQRLPKLTPEEYRTFGRQSAQSPRD